MKRTALLAAVGALAALAVAVPVAHAAGEGDCTPYTTEVTGRPDSGKHGDWATDDFTRTTKVCQTDDTTYVLTISDAGTFTTLAGAKSPAAGVDLPAPFTGSFTGGATVTVTSDVSPVAPPASSPGDKSTSEWASLLFPGNNGTISGWSWTYGTKCETWVNAEAGNSGDVTGVECEYDEEPSTTVPPTTTAPPSSSTSDTPPASGGDEPTSATAPGTSMHATSTSPAYGYAARNHGDYDSGEKDLAYTGTSSVVPYLAGLGGLLLLGGVGAVVLTRRRRANR